MFGPQNIAVAAWVLSSLAGVLASVAIFMFANEDNILFKTRTERKKYRIVYCVLFLLLIVVLAVMGAW